ncbi:RICIN domain-containing protein [Streptomyces sp. enrichment culture]|uniref:RICIN domain-containing protein n=1 Tax=Streptomyces sp. enrichment culture TaxID=1795815 RepID=UPI003F566302
MRFRTGLTGVAAAVCTTVAMAPSAYAADPIFDYKNAVVNEQTGRCLDSNSTGEVYTSPCGKANPYQQWIPSWDGAYAWQLKNVQTQMCLGGVSEAAVRTMPCTKMYGPLQWKLRTDRATNALVNQAWPNVLDSNSKGNVYLKAASDSNRYQSWIFSMSPQ